MSWQVDTIRSIYEAFGRGDGAAFLEPMADDVQWEHWPVTNSAQAAGVSYLQPRRGKAGVGEFLQACARDLAVEGFEISNILEGGREVAVRFQMKFTVKATGKRLHDDEIHLWTFNDRGRVIALRHFIDTAKHIEVNRP